MSQQINLRVAPPPGPRLSAGRAVLLLLLVPCVMLAYWQLQRHHTGRQQQALVQGQLQIEALQQDKLQHQTELDARLARRAALAAANARGRRQLSAALRARLGSGEFGSVTGHGRHLDTLARMPGLGVWLTSIAINQAGRVVRLEGQAMDRKAVLEYAKVLNQRFEVLQVSFSALELGVQARDAAREAEAAVTFSLH